MSKNNISQLNDLLRTTFIGGKVLTTPGIHQLPDDVQEDIITKVRTFDEFTEDNDPYGEHDFGAFQQANAGKIFWKIDYYAPNMEQGSEDPSDPQKTCRVLTIMLAEEY
ncbi:DUF3768 domain-containing protein [Sulfitobacter geojensis]|uniref:DUF3768 domain-containing protein n=1 Tax=Sulfitobacter geojensis TaxID=1342299 RepID=A0AAE2W2A1_9RHOB|nr:DUF3768 domain-containing protein [Sulfitobacter geojensis]MBM1691629.1 DUF3768 domain-containing protein [Sulfitobacter geojensis]MBM1695689.1 DUF3768 domain-containing protein [Sulfitobacter geojensis]MBM1707853.1 DUF3768 domain-containing protein [Sulfitobacter geojensis]MBM1711915.1 DUF3768 domain-containing protein [Sulfitobacter geojensis]MBM1715973.1 DUF3768 domain-containing protein [Sulfitobacter geojensis]